MLPSGEFIEVHQPLGQHGYAGAPVPKRLNQVGVGAGVRRVRGFFYPVRECAEIEEQVDDRVLPGR